VEIESLPAFHGFDWDDGNSGKNLKTHNVGDEECEAVFFNSPLLVKNDEKHSDAEKRYAIFGVTNEARLLIVVFTMRAKLVRVISARDMSRRERNWFNSYEKGTEI
jgi:uncharacterized protein